MRNTDATGPAKSPESRLKRTAVKVEVHVSGKATEQETETVTVVVETDLATNGPAATSAEARSGWFSRIMRAVKSVFGMAEVAEVIKELAQ
jgi:hypothetical protein